MKEGWDATGRLEALWGRVGGRDGLERITGILGQTLSGYNTGKRQMGLKNGQKIADALGVSIQDLGAPADDLTLQDQIAELTTKIENLTPAIQMSGATGYAEEVIRRLDAGSTLYPPEELEELADSVERAARAALSVAEKLRRYAQGALQAL